MAYETPKQIKRKRKAKALETQINRRSERIALVIALNYGTFQGFCTDLMHTAKRWQRRANRIFVIDGTRYVYASDVNSIRGMVPDEIIFYAHWTLRSDCYAMEQQIYAMMAGRNIKCTNIG